MSEYNYIKLYLYAVAAALAIKAYVFHKHGRLRRVL
jgi:hypothetical protein